jgi:hypothetical protein
MKLPVFHGKTMTNSFQGTPVTQRTQRNNAVKIEENDEIKS